MARTALLSVELDPLTIPELHEQIAEAVTRSERWIIANHNLHSIYLYHHDPKMRAFYEKAQIIHIDGMPLVFIGRLLGYELERAHRVTYVDWVRPLMKEAHSSGWRIFYLGGRPGMAQRAAEILKAENPGLELATHHGYFAMHEAENEEVLDRIRSFRSQVLLVGMGMPRQEYWILENLDRIEAHAILTAGACFDYLAGAIPTPPRWIGRLGLEWFYRLLSEPGRLWKRYLIEPLSLIPWIWKDMVGS